MSFMVVVCGTRNPIVAELPVAHLRCSSLCMEWQKNWDLRLPEKPLAGNILKDKLAPKWAPETRNPESRTDRGIRTGQSSRRD